jgi:hypothetical protein
MQKECYGTIFPDLLKLTANRPAEGKVFRAEIKSFGLGVQERKVSADSQQWEACKSCPDYRTCYDFGLGQLILESTLLSYG